MRTPVEERELSLGGYTYAPDGSRAKTLEVYTSDYSLMSKFDRFCMENPEEWRNTETLSCQGDVTGKRYQCSVGCVQISGRPRRGRPQTEEQKQAARERMIKMHEAGIL